MWGLSTVDTETALLEVTALATQVAQLQLRLLAHESRTTRAAANWVARLARQLTRR